MMKESIKEAMAEMLRWIEQDVPDMGEIENVSVTFANPDPELVVETFVLELEQPPKGIEDYESKRGLSLWAQRIGSGAKVGALVIYGTNEKLKAALQSEELLQKLLDMTWMLSFNLIDL